MNKTVEITKDSERLFKAIKQESFSKKRSSVSISKENNKVVAVISGSDPTAYKAANNSFNNALKSFNKVKAI